MDPNGNHFFLPSVSTNKHHAPRKQKVVAPPPPCCVAIVISEDNASNKNMPVTLTLLSNDERYFPISNEAASLSGFLRNILEEGNHDRDEEEEQEGRDSSTTTRRNLIVRMAGSDAATVERLVAFMNHHLIEPMHSMQSGGALPGAGQTWYEENFLTSPTRHVLSAILLGARDLRIVPLFQLMYSECLIWMMFRWGCMPTSHEVRRMWSSSTIVPRGGSKTISSFLLAV
jgi:hypothetical protein